MPAVLKGVVEMELLKEVEERLSIFKNLYDSIRIVEPIEKRVITVNNGIVENLERACYGFWNRNKFCDNCVSMRAYIKNDTCVKLECRDNSVLLVIATPMDYYGTTYILELLKDIKKGTGSTHEIDSNIGTVNYLLEEMGNKIIRDDLTGIYNRRYISERLPVDINKCIKNQTPLSVIMTDIDFFKKINDTYGHVIGDMVLKDFAGLINNNINNEMSWAARYGGEEFIIVLNNADIQTAYEISEEIRKKIEDKEFIYDDIHIKITSSFGVYCTDNKKADADDLIIEVDKNLYKAKQAGRNKTIK